MKIQRVKRWLGLTKHPMAYVYSCERCGIVTARVEDELPVSGQFYCRLCGMKTFHAGLSEAPAA